MNNRPKYNHAIRYCAVALLKARTTYTLHGATKTYKNYTDRNITSFSHKRSTNDFTLHIASYNDIYANMKARKLGVAAGLNGRAASRSVRSF